MPKPQPFVNAKKCKSEKCRMTGCVAAAACTMKTMQQEDPADPPMLMMACKGCGKCALACPYQAITMS